MKYTNFLLGLIAVLLLLQWMQNAGFQLSTSASAQKPLRPQRDSVLLVKIVAIENSARLNVKTEGNDLLPVVVQNGLLPGYEINPYRFAIPVKQSGP